MKSMLEAVLAGSGKDMVLAVGSQRAEIERLKAEMNEHVDMDDTVAGLEERSGLVGHCREAVGRCRQGLVGGELTAS